LLNTGWDTDAEIILGRMKTECLDAFRDGASYAVWKISLIMDDRQSYIEGRQMLNDVIIRAKAQEYLAKLQQHNNSQFLN